jgi:hypothetical protein
MCIYKNEEEEIIFYVYSLSHRRQEAFVSMLSELRIVLQLLGKELLAKIYENEATIRALHSIVKERLWESSQNI